MIRWELLVSFFVASHLAMACGSGAASSDAGPDGPIIKVKTPPAAKDGTGTVPACEGVTQRGTCEAGKARYCDLEREAIRQSDCKAQGKECVVDSSRGAICRSLDGPVSVAGFCDAENNIAVFTDAETGLVHAVNCSESDLTCHEDKCREGAYCCAADGGEPPDTGEGAAACMGFDLAGSCEGPNGNVATYCLAGELVQDDCGASGQRCEEDSCALGAFCCGEPAVPDECEQIGFEGVCTASGNVRYCVDGEIEEYGCEGTDFCQIGSECFTGGAECCEPPATLDNCGGVTFDGVCEGNVVRFCLDGELTDIDCATQTTSTECRVESGFAACRQPELSECEQIGFAGICQDATTVRYCSGGVIRTLNCTDFGSLGCDPTNCVPGGALNATCCEDL